MKLPDFFIVGAPKCGTTAMDDYLRQHPEVFIPDIKELHFFGRDLPFGRPRMKRERYLSLFAPASTQKRIGESSVWYLYSKEAAKEIREFSPSARIIVMLRDPVDAMHSMHSQRIYNGTENLLDFAEALAAEEDRKRGRRLPKNVTKDNLMGLYYRDAVRYTDQVRRYFEVFGRERVHVILFDDLRADTARVYRETCRFLEVDPGFRPRIEIVNANKRVRSEQLRNLVRFAPASLRALAKPLVPSSRLRQKVKADLKRWNTKYVARAEMDPALRKQLGTEFRSEVQRLGDLLGRDLSHWSRAPRMPASTAVGADAADS